MTEIRVKKSVSTVVTTQPFVPALKVEKATATVVTLVPGTVEQKVQKATSTVVILGDTSGNAKQSVSAERPLYRAGPIPYIQFTAGSSLDIGITAPGTYTLLLYKPDGSITQTTLNLMEGTYTLPTTDFNQAVLARTTDKRILRRIKLTFPLRV